MLIIRKGRYDTLSQVPPALRYELSHLFYLEWYVPVHFVETQVLAQIQLDISIYYVNTKKVVPYR